MLLNKPSLQAQGLLSLNSFNFAVVGESYNDKPVPNSSATSAGVLFDDLREIVKEERDELEDKPCNKVLANRSGQ